ncbi:MAG: fibronectin type III domain-containing protein [Candidatus Thermoplasmatota archaeon]|nr:fibronectin type III domain-containing protein [Candidatus Thermoplasmatota archaeon]
MIGSIQISFVLITMIFSSMIMYNSAPTDDVDNGLFFDLPPGNVKSAEATKISGSVFTQNNGQIKDHGILFYGSGPDGRIAFSKDGIYITSVSRTPEIRGRSSLDPKQLMIEDRIPSKEGEIVSINTIKLSFPGRNDVIPKGRDRAPWFSNFFYGNDPGKWRTQVPNYREIVYEDLWDGIDLVYRTDGGSVKYDIIIHPGSDPSRIGFRVEGHNHLEVNERGDLVITTDHRDVLDTGLVAFYEDGPNERIPCDFMITGHDTYGFDIGSYDLSRVLIVDPLIYSTFLGGSNDETGYGIAVDPSGNVYITGSTGSFVFPTTIGVYDTSNNGGYGDVFVTKINSSGSSLLYSTFIGGSGIDSGRAIELDSSGNAYITGGTSSTDYPITSGAYNTTYKGWGDVFVTKINPTGSSLIYSTFIGGSEDEWAEAIGLDPYGNVYVTGVTCSQDYPTTSGAFDTTFNVGFFVCDAFVTKLDPTGSSLIYSTFIGGAQNDYGYAITTDSGGNAYIAGSTNSDDYPTTSGAFDTTHNGGNDVFVTKIDPNGSSLIYSTFIGGSKYDAGSSITLDSYRNAYITGVTASTDYPTTNGSYNIYNNGGRDVFVTKLDPTGSSLIYSTFIGGAQNDIGYAIIIDLGGNAYIAGSTESWGYPTINGAYDTTHNWENEVFVTKLDPTGSSLIYSTFIGGSNDDYGYGIAVDHSGYVYITGGTYSLNFPTNVGSFDTTHNGGSDVFVTRIDLTRLPGKPVNLSVVDGDSFVSLSWDPPDDDGGAPVTDYEIFRGTQSGVYDSIAFTAGDTAFNDTSVMNGIGYYYAILAFNWVGSGEFSNEVTANPSTIPTSPRNVMAISGNEYVNLTWQYPETDGGSALLGYRLYKKIDGIPETEVITIEPQINNYIDVDVENGIDYRYHITAFNLRGESPPSDDMNANPRTIPLPVRNVLVTPVPGHLTLSWSEPEWDGGSPIINYNIMRAVQNWTFVKYVTLPPQPLYFNDYNVENGLSYRYRIAAINVAGSSYPSEEVSALPLDRPSPPLNFKVSAHSNSVTLTWELPLENGGTPLMGFKIYRMDREDVWVMKSELDSLEKTYVDSKAVNGRTYGYRITAFNSVGESDPTMAINVTPLGTPGPPVDFEILPGDGFISLSWKMPTDYGGTTITEYRIFKGEHSIEMGSFKTVESSNLSFKDVQVKNGKTYYYKVAAVNMVGDGQFTETKSARPAGIPSPPSNVQVTPGDGFIDISWTSPEDDGGDPVTEVRIHRGEEANSSVVILTTSILGGFFRDTAVENGMTYHYSLTSTNSIGESTRSLPIPVKPSGKPSVPLNVGIESSSNAISLSWDPPEDTGGLPIIKYLIYRSFSEGSSILIAEVGPETLEYMDRDVEGGREYRYQVSAVNDNGEGPLSDPVEGKVREDSGLVLIVAISVILVLLLLLLGIASAVLILRRRGPPLPPDASSPPIPSGIQESTP